jgi:hypothetical protein
VTAAVGGGLARRSEQRPPAADSPPARPRLRRSRVPQLSAALQEQGDAAFAPGGVWQQACENLNGEQLAYVAALATGAKLAFGDRPKEITYT